MKKTNLFAFIVTSLLQLAVATNLFAGDGLDSLAKQKSYFYSAKQELNDMLVGKIPLSYERAIFIMENSYRNNRINYKTFQSALALHTQKIKMFAKANRKESTQNFKATLLENEDVKREKYNKALFNYAIYTYITDTTFAFIYDSITGDSIFTYHLPYQYSTEDPLGSDNWKNAQVINLLDANTRKGNCFALASLFKIFSERLNSEANICTAPGHIYIQHADNKGIYYNVELASRAFPGTGSLETLTYTTDDATKNGISLRELDLKQSVGLCLVYLAKGYENKFKTKDDDFILQCAELALQYDSLNLNAMLLKAEVQEQKLISKNKTVAQLQADKQFKEYEKLIAHLYKLGYREMPLEMKNIIISALRKDTVPIVVQDHTPKPFKDIGVTDTRYATLSWGLFDEMHEDKPFEQYNRTMFDTKKKKINKFVKSDILYNKYNFDPVVFAWNVDPLAHKFPAISPYVAFANNPIYFVDKDGQEVKAANESAKTAILNTLTKADMAFVKFDKNGVIDKTLLSQANSNSGNFTALKQLVNDPRTYVMIVDNKFTYKNEKGDLVNKEMGPIEPGDPKETSPFGPKTGEEGWMGVTQTPGSEPEKLNSPDNTIRITINSGLSEEGQAENIAHEAYGHAYLYSKGVEHRHMGDNWIEENKDLREQIPARINETEKKL